MNGYPPIPKGTLEQRLGWLQDQSDPALLVDGIAEWGGALLPTSVTDDDYGPRADFNLMWRRGPNKGTLRTSRIVDPECLWVLQAHLWFGGGSSLKQADRDEHHYPDIGLGRVSVLRLVADTPDEHQAKEDPTRQFDYRRNSLRNPVADAAVRASGKRANTSLRGRVAAVQDSLEKWDANHVRAALGLSRAEYERLLWEGYALLDRLPLSAQHSEPR